MENNLIINFNDKEEIKRAIRMACLQGKPISDLELEMAIQCCMKHQLNPFLKEVYLVPMGNKIAPVVNYIVMANRVRSKYPSLKETWEYNWNEDKKTLFSVLLTVSNEKNSVSQLVIFSEYTSGFNLWASKPTTMLQKVARAQCYRLLDKDFQDMYIEEELSQSITPKTPIQEAKIVAPIQSIPDSNLSALKASFREPILTGNILCPNIIFNEAKHTYIDTNDIENPIFYQCVSDFLGKEELSEGTVKFMEAYAEEGKEVHGNLSKWILSGKEIDLKDIVENKLGKAKSGIINAYNLLNNLEFPLTFIATELIVCNPEQSLAGTIDFIASYEKEGETYYVIGDFKRNLTKKNQGKYLNQLFTYKQLLKEVLKNHPDIKFNFNRKNCKLMLVSYTGNKDDEPVIRICPIGKQDELKQSYQDNLSNIVSWEDEEDV